MIIDLENTLSQWFLTRNQNTRNISAWELFPALPIALTPKEAATSAFDCVEGSIPSISGLSWVSLFVSHQNHPSRR